MKAGYNGRIAVFWSQTEIDGLEAAPLASLGVGAAWSWHGRITKLPGFDTQYPEQPGFLDEVTVLVGRGTNATTVNTTARLARVELTNGAQRFEAELTEIEGASNPVLIFENGYPARGQEFWVCKVEAATEASEALSGRENVVTFPVSRAPTHNTLVLSPQMAASAAE